MGFHNDKPEMASLQGSSFISTITAEHYHPPQLQMAFPYPFTKVQISTREIRKVPLRQVELCRPIALPLKGPGSDPRLGTILWNDKRCMNIKNTKPRKESEGYMRPGYFRYLRFECGVISRRAFYSEELGTVI